MEKEHEDVEEEEDENLLESQAQRKFGCVVLRRALINHIFIGASVLNQVCQ
jgi:hypothetical protein